MNATMTARVRALLRQALEIIDGASVAVPYVPTDAPTPPAQTEKRVRKPRQACADLDAEVYDALCSTPAPQSAADIVERTHEKPGPVKLALRRLQASGRAKMLGNKKGARYLPLTAPEAETVDVPEVF